MAARWNISLDNDYGFLTDAQLNAEIERCIGCEEKPCQVACPVDCSPKDFIAAAKAGLPSDIARAAADILRLNPLGYSCGVICPTKHCMSACARTDIDRPVNIPAVQAALLHRAHDLFLMPDVVKRAIQTVSASLSPVERRRRAQLTVAVIGLGPSGIAVCAVLGSLGYTVHAFERRTSVGGDLNTIPSFRYPKTVLTHDLDLLSALDTVHVHTGTAVPDPSAVLAQGVAGVADSFHACVSCVGLQRDREMAGLENAHAAVQARDYLRAGPDDAVYDQKDCVAIIGGGAVAVDCATTALRRGAKQAILFYRRSAREMPIDDDERRELFNFGVEIVQRTVPYKVGVNERGTIDKLYTHRVAMKHRNTGATAMEKVEGSESQWRDITGVILAIGLYTDHKPRDIHSDAQRGLFYAGDYVNGASTAVEACAFGKNIAQLVHAHLQQSVRTGEGVAVDTVGASLDMSKPTKSHVSIWPPGMDYPVPLTTDFFGYTLRNPFLLSASPLTDGYEECKLALDAGWAGVVLKTCFDDVPIHIPDRYMTKMGALTYGNCDNVSGRTLTEQCQDIQRLVAEYPDRVIIGGTGGPVSADLKCDKDGWQSNTLKLEHAGAHAVEYSLSCPQGGDGSEGDIVSQNAKLTATIIDWVMEVSDPKIPKLFKLSAAVTSIKVIIQAVVEVLARYPDKLGGITLANSFPSAAFRDPGAQDIGNDGRQWPGAAVFGMAGEGVRNISYLTLANAAPLGITISGNGGVMSYENAANFLALGCNSVQLCTLPSVQGIHCIDDLCGGLSYYMESMGKSSIDDLRGCALPNPIVDFMDLRYEKEIATLAHPTACVSCGNCTRCPAGAITLDIEDMKPTIDPSKCIGCTMCVLKCPTSALAMGPRDAIQARKTPRLHTKPKNVT